MPTWERRSERLEQEMHDVLTCHFFLAPRRRYPFRPSITPSLLRGLTNHNAADGRYQTPIAGGSIEGGRRSQQWDCTFAICMVCDYYNLHPPSQYLYPSIACIS
jgi:hypothetical protein